MTRTMFVCIEIVSVIIVLASGLVRADLISEFVDTGLDELFEKHKEVWLSDDNREQFEKAVNHEYIEHV